MAGNEVQQIKAYVQQNPGVSYSEAAKALKLDQKYAEQAEASEKLSGQQDAPQDGLKKTIYKFKGRRVTLDRVANLPSGRKVEIYSDVANGEKLLQYKDTNGKVLSEAQMLKAEGVEGSHYVVAADGKLNIVKNEKTDNNKQNKKATGDVAGSGKKSNLGVAILGGVLTVAGGIMCATGVGSGIGAFLLAGGVGLMLSSCSTYDIDQNVQVTITESSTLIELISALKAGMEVQTDILMKILEKEIENGTTLDDIKKLVGNNTDVLKKLVNAMTENNKLLEDIAASVEAINGNTEEIFATLMEVKQTAKNIENLLAGLPGEIRDVLAGDLTAIMNAIKQGNVSLDAISGKLDHLAEQLETVIEQLSDDAQTQEEIKGILAQIRNGQINDGQKLLKIIEILNKINIKLDAIKSNLEAHYESDKAAQTAILNALTVIEGQLAEHNDKAAETNALLTKIYAFLETQAGKADAFGQQIIQALASLGINMNAGFEAILQAVQDGNVKLEDITALLTKINENVVANGENGKQMGTTIINSLNKFGYEITDDLDKIFEQTKTNGAKTDETNALLQKLYAFAEAKGEKAEAFGAQVIQALAALGVSMDAGFTALLKAVEEGNMKLDDATSLLTKLNALVERNGEIGEKLGKIIIGDIDKVLKAINKGNVKLSDITDLLTRMNANIEKNGTVGEALGNTIIDILTKMGFEISGDLSAILNQTKDNGAKADETNKLLTKIYDYTKEKGAKAEAFAQEVLKALGSLGVKMDANFDRLLQAVKDNKVSIDKLTALLAQVNANIDKHAAAGQALGETVLELLDKYGYDMTDKLTAILQSSQESNAKADVTNNLLKDLFAFMQTQGAKSEEFGKQVLDALAKIGVDANAGFAKILEEVKKGNIKLDDIQALLTKINANVVKYGTKGEKYGQAMINVLAHYGNGVMNKLNNINAAIDKGNVKLDDIAELLTQVNTNIDNYGEQGKDIGNRILAAIEKLGYNISGNFSNILKAINANTASSKRIESLLEKVLKNDNANTAKIIEAMGKIKVSGGKVDLSGLEAMLNALLKQSQANGDILASIDGKMDILEITIKRAKDEIIEKMGANNANAKAIMAKLDAFMNLSNANSDKILAKMDIIIKLLDKINNKPQYKYDDTQLQQKLDKIIELIKDHDVKVEVSGEVTCNCGSCGGNKHEGILGDLNDILG